MLEPERRVAFDMDASANVLRPSNVVGSSSRSSTSSFRLTSLILLCAFSYAIVGNACSAPVASFAAEPSASTPAVCDPDLWSTATRGGERNGLEIKGTIYAFRYCPPTGADGFLMGSPTDEAFRDDDETLHKVVLTEGFWLLETETTQELWNSTTNSDPSYFKGNRRPVETIHWEDANQFIRRLNACGYAPQGWRFSLPTESQWEYACRAGGVGPYGEAPLDDCAWHWGNSGKETHEVGLKRANAWGLYDMLGNVWEWQLDYYGEYPEGTATDPCQTSGSTRVTRGGCWGRDEESCRAASRHDIDPWGRDALFGFRLALVRE